MNLNEYRKMRSLFEAWFSGETLQYRNGQSSIWTDILPNDEYSFSDPIYYRIKPKPVIRPWSIDEIPVGALIKPKSGKNIAMIVGIYEGYAMNSGGSSLLPSCLLDSYEWKAPGESKCAWKPCGVVQ